MSASFTFATAGEVRFGHGHGLPGLTVLGVSPDLRPEFARKSRRAASMAANPVALGEAALIEIMEAAG